MYKELLFLHLFFAILWVGGMIYSLVFMRPALGKVDENCRNNVLEHTWGRFFYAVWLSIVVLFLTGMAMWHKFRPDFTNNTLFHLKLLMFAIMVINFAYIHLYLFRKRIFRSIPVLMTLNLILGILVVMVITYIH